MWVRKQEDKHGEKCTSVNFLQHGDVTPIAGKLCTHERVACLFRGCQEPSQPSAGNAVLTCSPEFLTVENHWETGSPSPNSSACDVSGMIFALVPFSRKATEGRGEFALVEFPTCLRPTDKSL